MARTLELDVIQTPDQTGTPEISLSTGNVTIPSVTIQGGTIEDTAIGAVTPDTGKFTNVEVTGTLSGSVTVGSNETFTMASGSNLSLQNNSITTSVIDNLAVTNAKLGASAVTDAKIADNAVITAKIKDSTGATDGVTTAKLADGAVTNAKIANATIETAKIGNNQVTLDKLAANSVDASKIKNFVAADPNASPAVAGVDAVTTAKINDGAVTTAKLATGEVTYAKIQNVSATNRILGRDSANAGPIEEITPANLRTMLNVENGATADQTNAEIRAAVEAASDSNVFTDADHAKLNSISITSSSVTDGTNTFSGQTIVAGDNISLSTSGNNVTINATGGEVLFVSLGKMSQTQQVPSGYIWVAYGTAQRTDDEASSYGNPSDYAYTTTSSMPQGSNYIQSVGRPSNGQTSSVGPSAAANYFGSAGYGFGECVAFLDSGEYANNNLNWDYAYLPQNVLQNDSTIVWAYTLQFKKKTF